VAVVAQQRDCGGDGAHLRMAEEDGASPRAFGNELLIQERTRDVWGWTGVETFWRDLGYALRQIRRAPGFAAVAILTLALGLGAITATFSIVPSVLLEWGAAGGAIYREPTLRCCSGRSNGYCDGRAGLVGGRHWGVLDSGEAGDDDRSDEGVEV